MSLISHSIVLAQTVRVMVLATIAFLVALAVTPLWNRFLTKRGFSKQLRESKDAPIFYELHKKKIGVPTGAGVMIWSTVVALAIVFDILNHLFDGFWHYLSFIDRAETYLPLAALCLAGLLGLLDDWLGVLKLGGASGGGLQVRHKSIFYIDRRRGRRLVVLLSASVSTCVEHPVRWQCHDRLVVYPVVHFYRVRVGLLGERDRRPRWAPRRLVALRIFCPDRGCVRSRPLPARRVRRGDDRRPACVPVEQYLPREVHDGRHRLDVARHHDRYHRDAHEHGASPAVLYDHPRDRIPVGHHPGCLEKDTRRKKSVPFRADPSSFRSPRLARVADHDAVLDHIRHFLRDRARAVLLVSGSLIC
jgi:hypothetical protein